MDILIKNMEMPKSCSSCDFTHICKAIKKLERKNASQKKMYEASVGRLADCPLVALPEHGRLIDADELEASDAILIGEEAWNMVHNAPTIVEAST